MGAPLVMVLVGVRSTVTVDATPGTLVWCVPSVTMLFLSVWPTEPLTTKAVWRSISMDIGGLSVTYTGTLTMPLLSVDSWDMTVQ